MEVTELIPELIPMNRDLGNRTDRIGTYADGMFMAYAIARDRRADLADRLAVLHLFNHDGAYIDTEFELFTIDSDEYRHWEQAEGLVLDAMLARLGAVELGPIAVRLFQFSAYGQRFGLYDRSAGRESGRIKFEPLGIVFYDPWTADYDT
jgi:hypothetical protein